MPKTATKPKPPKPAPDPTGVRAPALPEPPVSVGVPAAVGPETWANVRLDLIRRCAFNVRQRFTAEDVAGLGESIRADRLKEPLLVRPVGLESAPTYDGRAWSGLDHYEVADGERRLRALLWICETYPREAEAAALVPVIVRPMTDDRVRAVMLVSREQSRDLQVSELVAGYTELRKSQPDDAAVAALVGKSVAHVRGVLRLAKLPAWCLAAVDRGDLGAGVAGRVAQVGGEESRKRAAACVLLGYIDPDLLDDIHNDGDTWEEAAEMVGTGTHEGCEPLSDRDTKKLIADHFQKQLKGAPFSLKVLYDVPGETRQIRSCDECPQRAGNDPEATADGVRGDVCMDPDCYREKTGAYRAKEVERAAAKGVEPVGDDFRWPGSADQVPAGWFDPKRPLNECGDVYGACVFSPKDDRRTKPLDELLNKLLPQQWLAFDPKGKPRRLVRAKEVRAVLVELGMIPKPEPRPVKKSAAPTESRATEATGGPKTGRLKNLFDPGPTFTEIDEKAAEIASGVLREFAEDQCKGLTDFGENDPVHTLLGLAVRAVCYDLAMKRDGACGPILKRLGAVDGEDKGLAIDRAVSAMSAPQQMGLLVELAAAIELQFGSATRDTAADLLAFAEVDWEAVKEQARRALAGGESAEEKLAKAESAAEHDEAATEPATPEAEAPRPATRLTSIDNFPDAVADRLAPAVTTLPTLLEAVEASTAGIDLPLRNRLVTFFVKRGVKIKPAENAAAAVAEHVGKTGEKAAKAEAVSRPAPEPEFKPKAQPVPLATVENFPREIAPRLVKAGIGTLLELHQKADALDGLPMDVRLFKAIRTAGVGAAAAHKATNAVLVRGLFKPTRMTALELERAANPDAPYGFDVEYLTNRGETKSAHFVGTEADARRKAKLKTGFREVVKVTPFTEEKWVKAFGRGRM